jgi:hypothetical protein
MVRHLLLVAGLAVAGSVSAQERPLPPEIATFTEERLAECRGAGGTPALAGLEFPDADVVEGDLPPFLTEADLNGDGKPDYVTDLAGLDCVNAWSYFCGSAGCPVTVWLSDADGLSAGWSGHAQAWELRGTEVLLYLHGEMCTPPRTDVEGCEETLRFDAPSADSAADAAPVPPGALASSPRPRPRPGTAATGAVVTAVAPAPAEAAPPDAPVAETPAAPSPAPDTATAAPTGPAIPGDAPGWTSAQLPDNAGWYARVEDPETDARIDWICAKGRDSLFALTPAPEGDTITIDVNGRTQEFAVTAEDGTAYAPVAIGSALFLHIASGKGFRVLDAAGHPVARFSMRDAPLAIGQAEGRCQF